MRFPFFRISLFFPSRMHVYIYRKCQEWEYSSPGSDNSSTNLTRACACISIGEPRKFAGEGLLFFPFFLVVWSSTRGLMSDDVVLDIHTGICRSGYIYIYIWFRVYPKGELQLCDRRFLSAYHWDFFLLLSR